MKYVSRIKHGKSEYTHYLALEGVAMNYEMSVYVSDTESDHVDVFKCFDLENQPKIIGAEIGFKSVKLWRYKPEFIELESHLKVEEVMRGSLSYDFAKDISRIVGRISIFSLQYIDCSDGSWSYILDRLPVCMADYLINYANKPNDFSEDLSYAYINLIKSNIYRIHIDDSAKPLLAKLRLMR